MLSTFVAVLSRSTALCGAVKTASVQAQPIRDAVSKRTFSLLTSHSGLGLTRSADLTRFVAPVPAAPATNVMPCRTLIKFCYRYGKRKIVKTATHRFFRLHWGGWIRARCGRHKKLHQKRSNRKRRLRQHVLLNSTQSFLIDKMVNRAFRKPKYYINDPYEPYHTRDFFRARLVPGTFPEQPVSKASSSESFARYQPKSVYE